MRHRLSILAVALTTVISAPFAHSAFAEVHNSPLSFHVKDIDGKDVNLAKYRGKVVMIVNTASLCGNTPQYAGLESLYEKYKGQGLRILAFPEDNFMNQEPGSNGQIKQFCNLKFHTTFDLFSKISVKGPDQAPLYAYLTDKSKTPFGGDIDWNFAKFLVDRSGNVAARYPAGHSPTSQDVVQEIELLLKSRASR